MAKIIKNAVRCLSCNDVIESCHRYDVQTCRCRNISVDGGRDYLKRGYPPGKPEEWYVELSEWG
ncbi:MULTISPECIES: hypothetical protein [Paenibacillus]|uniref:DUF7695 domain-containing protein n=1 Tax=Paenibacillus TaxID=44249 RepID=UPI000944C93D|nr:MULTISPECIES: hypothetical protein [Paenibacillus]OMF65510.1 hypothetical protein BK142_30655 [Paenibacillus glucanolyticus]